MIKRLFCYGTLMAPALFEKISGVSAVGEAATLPGYRRYQLQGKPYPAVVRCPESEVQGCLYHGLGAGQLRRLDKYEGEWYRRTLVNVRCADNNMVKAWCYVIRGFHAGKLGQQDWSLEEFLRQHLPATMERLSFRNEYGVIHADRVVK